MVGEIMVVISAQVITQFLRQANGWIIFRLHFQHHPQAALLARPFLSRSNQGAADPLPAQLACDSQVGHPAGMWGNGQHNTGISYHLTS